MSSPRSSNLVSKALELSRARRGWPKEYTRYEASITPDDQGLGMSIERCCIHGAHLGIPLGGVDLVMGVEEGSPAHRRGLMVLDRIVEIEGRPMPLDRPSLVAMLNGKRPLELLIERYHGDAIANLAWHTAIAACMRGDPDLLENVMATLADCGLDGRTGRVRRDDVKEFERSDGVSLVEGSTLADVALDFDHLELADWLGDGGAYTDRDDTEAEEDGHQEEDKEAGGEYRGSSSSSATASSTRSSSSVPPRSPREHLLQGGFPPPRREHGEEKGAIDLSGRLHRRSPRAEPELESCDSSSVSSGWD